MATYTLEKPTAALPNWHDRQTAAVAGVGVRNEFRALADWWHEATDHLSSSDQIVQHRAYRRIIDEMGAAALPYIFEDLQARGGLWYRALREITKASPTGANTAGNIRAMKTAWLRWGKGHGYVAG